METEAWRTSVPGHRAEQERDLGGFKVRSAYSPLSAFFPVLTMVIPDVKGCEL